MADFKIQRGTTTLTNTSTTVTITAGSEYTAPSAASKAFCRVVNSCYFSGGTDSQDTSLAKDTGAKVTNNNNITTSITFGRFGTVGATLISWEIIEYTGSGGGANEFIVRDDEVINLASATSSADGTAVASVSDDADIVVWITGQAQAGTTAVYDNGLTTAEWLSGTDQARITRSSTAVQTDTSIVVLEFTGSNWKIQRSAHNFSASGSAETETITAVGSLSKTFIHNQLRHNSVGLDEVSCEIWLSATNTVSFELKSGAGVTHDAVAWVIENTQASGTVMDVNQYSGTRSGGATGNPDAWDITLGAAVTTAETSIGSNTGFSSGTGTSVSRAMVNARLKDANTVELRKPEDGQDWDYRFETVEWPTAAAPAGEPLTAFHPNMQNSVRSRYM